MANETVKYHNDMASVNFPNFSPTDHNVFMSICYECKGKGTEIHSISLKYLKELSGFGAKDDKRFMKYLNELTAKMHSIYYKEEKADGGFKSFSLFSTFDTVGLDTDNPVLIVETNRHFAYILNSDVDTPEGVLPLLGAGYTEFELRQHNAVNSTYSKIAFRQLKRFKRTGWWRVSMGEFYRLLDIPQSYRLSDLRRRVLTPIKEELSDFFEDLTIEEIKGTSLGPHGRRTTVALHFSFKPQIEKGVWYDEDAKAELSADYACPICNKPLYAIVKQGGEVFYGHKDGWKANAECRKTFSSLEEILGRNGDVPLDMPEGSKIRAERAGFSCRECGRPLYKLFNEKGEMFYGHIDGWKEDAPCRKTYSSIAEIKGFSETPMRDDHIDLYDKDELEEGNPEGVAVYETIRNVMATKEVV